MGGKLPLARIDVCLSFQSDIERAILSSIANEFSNVSLFINRYREDVKYFLRGILTLRKDVDNDVYGRTMVPVVALG